MFSTIRKILYMQLFIALNNADSQVQFEMMCKCSEQIKATCLTVVFFSPERNKRYEEAALVSSGSISAFCLIMKHEPLCFSFHSYLVIPLSVSSTLCMYKSFFGEFSHVWVHDEFILGGFESCLIDSSLMLIAVLFCLLL